MNDRHRYVIGAAFLCHGLVRTALAFILIALDPALGFFAGMIVLGMAVPSLFGGYNLLTNHPSAHAISTIAALINLFDLPLGTALSIYYAWYWKYRCGAPNPFRRPDSSRPERLA